MKKTTSNLPLELQAFASLLCAQPPDVQEAFQFLLATAMHEAGRLELVRLAVLDVLILSESPTKVICAFWASLVK